MRRPGRAIAVLLAGTSLALSACVAPTGSIGAILSQRGDGTLRVREVPEGMAAARAGLRPGDEIVRIEGEHVRDLGAEEVHARLVGPVGSTVTLTIVREREVVDVRVVRGPWRTTRRAGSAAPAAPSSAAPAP